MAHYISPRGKSPALDEVRFNPHQVRLNQALENSKTFKFPIFFFVFFEFFQDFAMFGSISPGVVQMSPCVKVLYLLHIA